MPQVMPFPAVYNSTTGIGVNMIDPDYEPRFNLGAKAYGTNGSLFVYGKCGDGIFAYRGEGRARDVSTQETKFIFTRDQDNGEVVCIYRWGMRTGEYGWFGVLPTSENGDIVFNSPI